MDFHCSLQFSCKNLNLSLVDEISGQADMDIPTMKPNQTISGRQIKLVKNEFKINILDGTKTLGLWRVDIQVKIKF